MKGLVFLLCFIALILIIVLIFCVSNLFFLINSKLHFPDADGKYLWIKYLTYTLVLIIIIAKIIKIIIIL